MHIRGDGIRAGPAGDTAQEVEASPSSPKANITDGNGCSLLPETVSGCKPYEAIAVPSGGTREILAAADAKPQVLCPLAMDAIGAAFAGYEFAR